MTADEKIAQEALKFSIRKCPTCTEPYIKTGWLGDGNHGTSTVTDLGGNPLCAHLLRIL